jgi:hypothetical protein
LFKPRTPGGSVVTLVPGRGGAGGGAAPVCASAGIAMTAARTDPKMMRMIGPLSCGASFADFGPEI